MQISDRSYSLTEIAKYLQITLILVLLLYFGKTLFVPISFGLLIAVVTYPACKWLEAKRWPRSLAVGVLVTLVVILFIGLVWLLAYELNLFLNDIPLITGRLSQFNAELSTRLESTFGMHKETQLGMIASFTNNFQQNLSSYASNVIQGTLSTIFTMVLVPVYAVLFLYQRGTFVRFLESMVANKHKEKLAVIIHQSIFTYFKFVKGTFFVYCIVGVLNSAGLLALGIDHAILFGMITAFMTAIPYVGIYISAALPVSVALVTKDSVWYSVGVIAVFSVVQYLEANVIFPRVVGQQLNLSTWAVLVAIIIGTLLWGISGMILFIPFAAILKIVSDHIDDWKPLNILLNRNQGYKNE